MVRLFVNNSSKRKEEKEIKQVYWVACGGSLVDLYPAHVMLNTESKLLEFAWYTSKESLLMPPKKLGKQSLLIACSHFGNTKETVDIATLVFCFPFMLELSEMVVTFRFEWYLIVVN